MIDTNAKNLKHYLQIKSQLKYVTRQHKEAIENGYPMTAISFWEGMMEAYTIAMMHMNGEEV